ncbi:MAG: methyltransferase [Nitrososphaerota archaeon]|nr:methyltransferase [Candidatus Bathyarchaeota archaeon]MDW8022685.1 methyltransferase [Nitrososphaerota archaeon]
MPTVQAPTDIEYYRIATEYVKEIYKRHKSLINFINNRFFRKLLFRGIKVYPILNVNISSDLRRIDFYYNEQHHIATIDQKLLWPCICRVPSEYRNTDIKCPIHSEKSGEIIQNAFGHGIVKINFGDVEVYYKDNDTLWPPSIDSLFFAVLLQQHFKDRKDLRKICDIGSGTGFLGIWLSKINNSVKEIVFTDIFISPVFLSAFNCYRNCQTIDVRYRSFASNAFDDFKEEKYDLIICNPPYLPLLGVKDVAGINAVSGTYLLKRIVIEAGKFTNELVIGASDIVKPELKEFFEEAKKLYSRLQIRELGFIEVPFTVTHAFQVSGYMRILIRNRKKYFSFKQQTPIRIWHTVRFYHLTYR